MQQVYDLGRRTQDVFSCYYFFPLSVIFYLTQNPRGNFFGLCLRLPSVYEKVKRKMDPIFEHPVLGSAREKLKYVMRQFEKPQKALENSLYTCFKCGSKTGQALPWAAVEMFYTTVLPLLLCILQTFPHSPSLDTFLRREGHLHRQRCCVHTILMIHVFLSFPYLVSCLFSQSSLYSSCPHTFHRLGLKYFQSLHTV